MVASLWLGYLQAQQASYTDEGPHNLFRHPANPHYWKNKLPYPGYWQQDVHYRINARIDETTDIITGSEDLTYYNNSPDTLRYVYFHLYQNAFTPGSYLHDLQCHNQIHPNYGKYERQGLGTQLDDIKSGNTPLTTETDNTIVKVYLPQPLLPGDSVSLQLKFRTYFDAGTTRRRMKKYRTGKFTHYNGCQWYPKLCVYDRKSGWNTDQHLNREFYGDYGTFDVALTFASNYVVEATGVLQNESEVLPDTLKQKLHLRNFKHLPWDTVPSTVIPYKKGQTKTWIYHAENVHDFAFTANPYYRIADTIIYPGRANGAGVRCVAIALEQHASGWQNAATYLARIIDVFSRDFGVFEYPKIVVADAQDGMEYPMLTLDGGREPEFYGLLVHEVGHNWFYGMLGNNETYRPMLDEGFTQFLTAWGMEALNGDTIPYTFGPKTGKYYKRFFEPQNVRDSRVYISYLSDAVVYNDEPINTHSDMFNGALGQGGGYRHVYAKTATMLYNLQYVLGDTLFLNAMKHYVQQWKFCHPYPEDFRNSISRYTKVDLNWFFDQWMETTKNIDYAITKVRRGQFKGEYEVTIRRKGRMQMPLDLLVKDKNDSIHRYYIPNNWFEKNTPPGTVTLQRWIGWDKLQPTYVARVKAPAGIKDVVIDPSERMADIDMTNNRLKNRVEYRFDSHIYPPATWKKYRIYLRPDLWWNAYDGLKAGVHAEGNYMGVKNNFSLTLWINTHLAQGGTRYYFTKEMRRQAGWVSYIFSYSTAIDKVMKKTTFYFQSRWLDGYEMYRTGITKNLPHNVSLDIHIKAFTRNKEDWRNYLLYPDEWSSIFTSGKKFNTSLNVSATYTYSKEKVSGTLSAHLRSGLVTNAFNYNYITLTHVQKAALWKFDIRTRVFARYGTGNDVPAESALFFAGGNPEEMMESKYYRAAGFVPQTFAYRYGADINNLHFGGGLNMRGYAGYLLPVTDVNGVVLPAYRGNSGIGLNAEIDFNRLVTVKKQKLREAVNLNTYLFFDVGSISYTNSNQKQVMAPVRADAGAGIALTIKKWGPLQNIKPLTFRFDVPFFISHAPAASPRHFDFRWVVGINRAF